MNPQKGYQSEIQQFKKQLEESGALEKEYAETGNMTVGIEYATAEKRFVWTWKKTGAENDVPEPLQEWYQQALTFCQSLEKD